MRVVICPVCQKEKELEWRKGRIYRADPKTLPVVPQKCILVKVLKKGSRKNGIMEWQCPVSVKIGKTERYSETHFRRRN